MKEYLLLLRGGVPMSEKTQEDAKTEMAAWGAYMGSLAQGGQFVGGLPLVAGGRTVSATGTTEQEVISAGEGIVGGYLILKADSLDAAAKLAANCPHVANQGNIEVREIAPMPPM